MDLIMNDLNFIYFLLCAHVMHAELLFNLDPHMTCLSLVIVTA
jgi:hypothetical protein